MLSESGITGYCILPLTTSNWGLTMLERTISRYLSWAGFFVVVILVCAAAIWDWRLLSVAFAFTGLLVIALTAIADRSRERYSDRQVVVSMAYRRNRKVARLQALLSGGISCLFLLLVFLFFVH